MWTKALLVCSIFLIASGGVIKKDSSSSSQSSTPLVPSISSTPKDTDIITEVDDDETKQSTTVPSIASTESSQHNSDSPSKKNESNISVSRKTSEEVEISTPSTPAPSSSSGDNLKTKQTSISVKTTTDVPIKSNDSIGSGGSSILPGWFEPKNKKQIILIKDDEKEDDILPNEIKSSFAISEKERINLKLRRVENIKAFPTIIDEKEAEEVLKNLFPSTKEGNEKIDFSLGVYQDQDNNAAMIITGEKRGATTVRSMEGKFVMKEKKYKLTKIQKKDFNNELNGFPDDNDPVKDGVPHIIQPVGEDDNANNQPDDKKDPIPGGGSIVFGDSEGELSINPHVVRTPKHQKTPPIASDASNYDSNAYPYTSCQDFHIETMVVVPKDVYEFFWTQEKHAGRPDDFATIKRLIQLHYARIFNDADIVYKSVHARKWGICLTLWLSNIKFLVQNSQDEALYQNSYLVRGSSYETDVVDSDKILDNLGKWKIYQSYGWYKMDVIVLFTKRNLGRKDQSSTGHTDSTVGTARWNGVCKFGTEGGLAVVEDIGGATWWILAHEVAHVIGAVHDGSGSAASCTQDLMNIMSPVLRTWTPNQYENAYKFSDCSIRDIKNLLTGLTDNYPRTCTTNKACVILNKQELSTYNSNLEENYKLSESNKTLSDQCKSRYSLSHGACNAIQKPWTVDICNKLYCSIPVANSDTNDCIGNSPGVDDGTKCGTLDEKWCYRGKCIDKNQTPSEAEIRKCKSVNIPPGEVCSNTDEKCWYDVIKEPFNCFQDVFYKRCCGSCNSYGLFKGTWYQRTLDPSEYPTSSTTTCKDLNDDCPAIAKKYGCEMEMVKTTCPRLCKTCEPSTHAPIPTTPKPSEYPPGPCNPNPCLNNAICLGFAAGGGIHCQCPRGFYGERCEISENNNGCRDDGVFCMDQAVTDICKDDKKRFQCRLTCGLCSLDSEINPLCTDTPTATGLKCSTVTSNNCESCTDGTFFRSQCCKTCYTITGVMYFGANSCVDP